MSLNKNVLATASNDAASHSYDIQIFSENQNFNMPKSASSYFLNIPKDTVLGDDCYVTIHYDVSNTLISNLSNMSLSVNGVPIDTEWICNIQKISPNYWKVNIPIDKLKVGATNEIRVESDHRSIIGDCADIDNPGNWVTIYNDSKIHISDKSVYSPTLSGFYPAYFEDFGSNQSLTSNFVLPKVKSNDLISDLLKLSSSIGSLYSDRNLINYNVVEDNTNEKSTANSILIAPIDKLEENKNLILSNNKLSQNQGFLSISNKSQENPYYNTVISGENQEGINKATDFISNNTLLKQIKDTSLTVDSKVNDEYNKFAQNKKGLYKFSDWGYSDVNLSGAFHRKASFSFVQPNGIQAGNGSYVNLKFKHSKILLSDRSLLTIYIDGKVINNSKLSDSNAEDGNLKVQIPDSALKKPVIKVDVEVYNYIGKIDCSKDYYDSAWTYINSNSEVCLVPGRLAIQPSLNNFPYFNTYNENKQPQILMSFSKNINNDDLNTASIIASRAGQNSKEVFDFDILNGDSELTKIQKDEDMIFIGSFNNINLPDKIKNSIPIVPLKNNKFKIKEGLQVVPETLKNKTVIQVIRSPWNFYKRVYVITYDNSSNLKAFKSVLSDTNNLQKIENQVSVIDNKTGINNMAVSDSEDNKVPVTFASIIQVIEDKSGFSWWVLLISLILAVMCIAAIIKLRKKNNQFQDAGDKMKKSQDFQVKETVDNENKKK
jgi:hypothetical protein